MHYENYGVSSSLIVPLHKNNLNKFVETMDEIYLQK